VETWEGEFPILGSPTDLRELCISLVERSERVSVARQEDAIGVEAEFAEKRAADAWLAEESIQSRIQRLRLHVTALNSGSKIFLRLPAC
jgi:hypothetical protein